MSEPSSNPVTPNPQSPTLAKASPPPTPPSPDAIESDPKLSRKREREVSLEPATTPRTVTDADAGRLEHRETRTPAKKNRRHLEGTQEEDDGVLGSRSPSRSPPLSTSPRQEMKIKVRQISRGVEDINWKNNKMKGLPTPEHEVDLALGPADNGNGDAGDAMSTSDEAVDLQSSNAVPESSIALPDSAPRSPLLRPTMDVHEETPLACANSEKEPPQESSSRQDSDSDGGDKEKRLKRKHGDRGTSQGPQDKDVSVKRISVSEPLKRPRDDADVDSNPRETKRPSPPPDPTAKETPIATPKLSGFMAYASTSSPFAAVKGQNIFASKASPSPTPSSSNSATSSFSPFTANFGESSNTKPSGGLQTPLPTPAKRTGFEAFASSTSPFAAAARSKSPVLGSTSALKLNRNKSPSRRANPANVNAFSSYAGEGVQSFAVPVTKRARAGSPADGSGRSSLERNSTVTAFGSVGSNGSPDSGAEDDNDDSSFGAKLRASKDDEETSRSDDDTPRITLTEQEFTTGEEDEETIHQVRGKLFSLSSLNQWKERGTGTLKLNVRRSDGLGARLVMRKEAVYTVLLNVTLFHGMRCVIAQDPRYLRFSVLENGIATHYNLRVASAKIAVELLEEINANIPSA